MEAVGKFPHDESHGIFPRGKGKQAGLVPVDFGAPTQCRLLARFRPLSHPGGPLFVGRSGRVACSAGRFWIRGKTVCVPLPRGRAA